MNPSSSSPGFSRWDRGDYLGIAATHTRDSVRLGGFPRQVAAKLSSTTPFPSPLSARQPVRDIQQICGQSQHGRWVTSLSFGLTLFYRSQNRGLRGQRWVSDVGRLQNVVGANKAVSPSFSSWFHWPRPHSGQGRGPMVLRLYPPWGVYSPTGSEMC